MWLVALGMLAYCGLCYGGMLLFREWVDPAPFSYARFALVGMVGLLAEGGSRPDEWRATPGRGVGRFRRSVAQRQWLWMSVSVALLLVLSRDIRISRAFVVFFEMTSFLLLYASNRWGHPAFVKFLIHRSPHWKLRAVVVGPEDWLRGVQCRLGSVSDVVHQSGDYIVRDDTKLQDLVSWIEQRGIDLLVMPARLLPDFWVIQLMALGERRGFRCWLPLDVPRRAGLRFTIQRMGELDVLTPPEHPLGNTFNRMLKRGFDIAFALFVMTTVLLPLMAAVWVMHRLYSPGPLFFRQNRLGENGKIFQVVKFRTMHVNNDNEGRQACKSDPRIFKGGGLLRKLSIDEFPQFLNVLRGEMSVVGPRPHLESHEREFEKFYERYGMRRMVKPGVTGLAQVRGYRGEIMKPGDIRGRARYDIIYLGCWCVSLDFRIIFQTALQVIRPHRNAY